VTRDAVRPVLTADIPVPYTDAVVHVMRCRIVCGRLAALLAGGLLLVGCSSLSSWLGMGGTQRSPHEAVNTSAAGESSSFMLRKRPAPADEIRVVDLLFDVVRVDFPIDGVRHSRKIWNHVDELRVDSELISRLARNGLRVGAASPYDWPAIRAIIEAAGAEVRRDTLAAQRGLPLTIKLSGIDKPESIFSYGRDGRLVGKTFPAGDKLFNLDYAYHPELGGCTDLGLSFEIRHDQGVMTWEKRDGIIRQAPAYDQHVFSDLSALLTLSTDEFLVVGLDGQSGNEYLIGSRFLTFELSGKRYETLFCVTPQPYQTRGVKRRPP